MKFLLNNSALLLLLCLLVGLTVTESRQMRDGSDNGQLASRWVDIRLHYQKKDDDRFHLSDETERQEFKKFALGPFSWTNMDRLQDELGNTIYAMVLDRLGRYWSLPDYYEKALDNGVLCEVSRCNASMIKSIQYQSDTLTIEQREKEIEAAKHEKINFDCSNTNSTSFDECFCSQNNTLLYCAALKFKRIVDMREVAKTICEEELFHMITHKSVPEVHASKFAILYRELGLNKEIAITLEAPSANVHADWYINDPTSRKQASQLYCMAAERMAHTAVKNLFAANALRWTIENHIIEAVFNGTHDEIARACASSDFELSEIGRCACKGETGLTFCIFKARAEYLKKIGYLICNGDEMKFVNFKYPLTLPPFLCLSDFHAALNGPECEFYRSSI